MLLAQYRHYLLKYIRCVIYRYDYVIDLNFIGARVTRLTLIIESPLSHAPV